MDRLLSDVTHAWRRLAHAPAFALLALSTLALGIGANTAIFSIVKSVLLQPLPYSDPTRVVMIWRPSVRGATTWISASEVQSYAQEVRPFAELAAYTKSAAILTGGAEPERVVTAEVTPNLFHTLGVSAFRGRVFLGSDAPPGGAPNAVMLSYGLWRRRFGGDERVVGQTITVNGRAWTVVGVLPASFQLPLEFDETRATELWTPLSLENPDLVGWGNRSLLGVARSRPSASAAQATLSMRAVEDGWVRQGFVRDADGLHRRAVPAQDLVVGNIRYALFVLVGAVGVILLIACANVANLILARSDERHREIALRAALGGSRARLVRQLLTESVLLALIGGALGTLLAYAGTKLLVALHPPGVPRIGDVGIDVGVFVFTLLLAVATGVLFGIAPALELSRPDLARSLKEGGRTGTVRRARQRFRDSLAVAQMAFSVTLLIGATLLLRSFGELRRINLGFDSRDALTFRLGLPETSYPKSGNVIDFYRTLAERLAQVPGVRAVGASRLLPLTGTIGDWSITVEGHDRAPGENPNADWQVVTPGYFESMGLSVVRGRSFTNADGEHAPLVAVVNETMAARYWPGENALGRSFHLSSMKQPWVRIVGIVRQVRHNAVVEGPRAEMYIPHAQFEAAGGSTMRGLAFVVRAAGDPLALVGPVRAVVHSFDPNLPVAQVRTLQSIVDDALSAPHFTTMLLGLFAALALTLATIGIYGVMSLLVTRRRQEIGIRMVLGARRRSVVQMVVGRGMVLAALGVTIGLIGAAWTTRALAGLLYGVTRFDPLTFATAPLVLVTVTLLACLLPALRAAALDPAIALRDA